MIYGILADLVLVLHFLWVLFIIVGQCLILIGAARKWCWIRWLWFRMVHLAAICLVIGLTWLGEDCPLTVWENALRESAGQEGYQGNFMAHWIHRFLFYEAPGWVFAVSYTGFGILVLLSWFLVPPGKIGSTKSEIRNKS